MNKEDNFWEELKKIKFSFHKNYRGIYLTDEEVKILLSYGFDIKKYKNIKDLMFDIETFLEDNDSEELEIILENISEFNFYNNIIQ